MWKIGAKMVFITYKENTVVLSEMMKRGRSNSTPDILLIFSMHMKNNNQNNIAGYIIYTTKTASYKRRNKNKTTANFIQSRLFRYTEISVRLSSIKFRIKESDRSLLFFKDTVWSQILTQTNQFSYT